MKNNYVTASTSLPAAAPVAQPHMATSGDGRYLFILGSKKYVLSMEHDYACYALIRFDLYTNTSREFHVRDMYDFGFLLGFYALDESTIVLADYSEMDRTIRQRLIRLADSPIADYFLHRTLRFQNAAAFFFVKMTVADERCIAFSPPTAEHPTHFNVLVFPSDPLSPIEALEISKAIVDANATLQSSYDGRTISRWEPPFFGGQHEICFFTDYENPVCADPTFVVAIDLRSMRMRVHETTFDSATQFPCDGYGQRPYDCEAFQSSDDQLTLLTTYKHHPSSWQAYAASAATLLINVTWKAFFASIHLNMFAVSNHILHTVLAFTTLRSRLIRSPYARMGVLSLTSWTWREVAAPPINTAAYYTTKAAVFDDGQTALLAMPDGGDPEVTVTRPPHAVLPLRTLAEAASRVQGGESCPVRRDAIRYM